MAVCEHTGGRWCSSDPLLHLLGTRGATLQGPRSTGLQAPEGLWATCPLRAGRHGGGREGGRKEKA